MSKRRKKSKAHPLKQAAIAFFNQHRHKAMLGGVAFNIDENTITVWSFHPQGDTLVPDTCGDAKVEVKLLSNKSKEL